MQARARPLWRSLPSRRRSPFWRRPAFWLLAQAIAVYLWMGVWRPLAVLTFRDTATYREALAGTSLREDLAQARTLGYPLFLAAVETLGGADAAVVRAQLALYLLAVVGFGLGAGAYLGSGWVGLTAATPLFYSRLAGELARALLSDLLAAAFAVLAAAFLLLLVARPPGPGRRTTTAWIGLAAALFAAYHTRPAYLFLIAALPLLGLVLTLFHQGSGGGRAARWQRTPGLCAVALLPFLAWCGLRWAVVGHFGLVGFGGTNLIGIVGSMLSDELVQELPRQQQPLARAILDGRRRLGLGVSGELDYRRWCADYNANVHQIALPAALELHGGPGTDSFQLAANRGFTALSLAVIRRRPGLYLRWVWEAMVGAIQSMAGSHLLRGIALLLVASAGVAQVLGRARERPAWARVTMLPGRRAWGLLVAGLVYAALAALVVALVEWPLDRYVFAAELLLPSGLAALAADLWRRAPAPATSP